MPTEMLVRNGHRATLEPLPELPAPRDERRAAEREQRRRVRRLRLNVAAWALGTIVLTTLWVVNQWQANGALERFGHEGEPGQWNPTLWAVAVGGWGLVVGIMALRVRFVRPGADARLERLARLRFHVAAWVLGMVVLTPLWALIEWQDNGGFERFGSDSTPGVWDPWILVVGGIWALVVVAFAIRVPPKRKA